MHPTDDLLAPTALRRFLHGARLPVRALRLLREHPALWPLLIVPLLIGASLLVGAAWGTLTWGGELTRALISPPTGAGTLAAALRGLWWMSNALVHLTLFGALAMLSLWLTAILASPFYDRLSAGVELRVLGPQPTDDRWPHIALDVLIGVLHSLLALSLYAALWCPSLLLHLLPGFGSAVQFAFATTLSALFLTRELLDYSLSRRRLGFLAKLRLVHAHLATSLGLGFTTVALLWVPLANLLSMPVVVVAGTLLYCDLERERLIPPR